MCGLTQQPKLSSSSICAPRCGRSRRPFRTASVELWAVDEHRIGLKPILHKVWALTASARSPPVAASLRWRYLVGFVHPASGRTVFHLAIDSQHCLF